MDDQSLPDPLLAALWNGDRATALSLIASGADPNGIDSRDFAQACTPLHLAADNGDAELVRALILAGAKLEARSVAGQTPLWWACNNGHTAAAQELLAAGANPNARSLEGYSPLGRVYRSDAALKQLLQSYGGVI